MHHLIVNSKTAKFIQALFALLLLIFINTTHAQQYVKIDSSFATNGTLLYNMYNYPQTYPVSFGNFYYSSYVHEEGDFIIAGRHNNGGDNKYFLSAFKHNGQQDTSLFNMGAYQGLFLHSSPSYSDNEVIKLIKLHDGKFLIMTDQVIGNGLFQKILVSRLQSNGQIDSSFATNGILTTNLFLMYNNDRRCSRDMFLVDNSKIVIIGHDTSFASSTKLKISRFNQDGSVDATYGTNGTYISTNDFYIQNSFQNSSGEILMVGYNTYNQTTIKIMKLNSTGNVDASFNAQTINIPGISGTFQENISCIRQQTDGKYLITGNFFTWNYVWNSFIIRCNSDGSIDNTFNGNGIKIFNSATEIYFSPVLYQNNKIYIGGWIQKDHSSENKYDYLLMRLNYNGSIDSAFGTNGSIIEDLGINEAIWDLKMQNGKLLVFGNTGRCTGWNTFVARYLIDLDLGITSTESDLFEINLFPNPVVENAILKYQLNSNSKMQIDITDIFGRTVLNICENDFQEKGLHQKDISLQNLSKGIYFINLRAGNHRKSITFNKL